MLNPVMLLPRDFWKEAYSALSLGNDFKTLPLGHETLKGQILNRKEGAGFRKA